MDRCMYGWVDVRTCCRFSLRKYCRGVSRPQSEKREKMLSQQTKTTEIKKDLKETDVG